MEVTHGLWTISSGKGDRHYIKCDGSDKGNGRGLMHPEQLAGLNGVGMYGANHLQDPAIAILMFEEAVLQRDKPLSTWEKAERIIEEKKEQTGERDA